ncbi:hypothetical protein ACQ5SO_19760 [Rhodovulum sp. DZ06]|uniref:hypothetical protein n=1 Tax=Rhodovulum sp. DZ06 TaxID=3425126 RepID=UPI003D32AA49
MRKTGLRAAIHWLPPEAGGWDGPPRPGMRPGLRPLPCGGPVRTVSLLALSPAGAGGFGWLAILRCLDDAPPPGQGAQFALTDGPRVIAVGVVEG